MNSAAKHYLNRLRAGISPETSLLTNFIEQETFLDLNPFSFAGHEYQKYFTELIQNDPNIDITAEKCSQIGLSEICFRIVLGQMSLHPGYSVLYAMPSKTFSQEVLKTRISPIIDGSPHLKGLISREVDSASVKMFVNSSILYALGASANSSSSLINRPVTLALTDELDKCDSDTVSGFRSRQTHSTHKPRIAISTPTAPGIGINSEADNRQLHQQLVICNHCGHEFIPSYYDHVVLPGWDAPIRTITEADIQKLNLDTEKAYLKCPKCHNKPKLTPKHRRWDVQDPHLRKIHVRLTPFDAPSFITPSDLIISSVTFTSEAEFMNQALGLPSNLSDATIDRTTVKFVNDEVPSGLQVAGLDLGKKSYYMQATVTDNQLFIHSPENIPVGDLKNRVSSNITNNRVVSMVSDSLPFLDTVTTLTNLHAMFWGAIYSVPNQPQPELYKLKMREDVDDGLGTTRQINIQKNPFMDHVAGMIASEQIVFKSSPFDEEIVNHLMDMRRVRDHRFSEMRYKWIKSAKGVDHWWHTLCYLVAASKIIQKTNSSFFPISSIMSTFRIKADV